MQNQNQPLGHFEDDPYDGNGTIVTEVELFPDSFMQRHTTFATYQELVEASGITSNAQMGTQMWWQFIESRTDFDGWDDMYRTAVRMYVAGLPHPS